MSRVAEIRSECQRFVEVRQRLERGASLIQAVCPGEVLDRFLFRRRCCGDRSGTIGGRILACLALDLHVTRAIKSMQCECLGGDCWPADGGKNDKNSDHHAASNNLAACARASSVTEAPESMRAISSRRSASFSLRTVVR